MEINFGKKYIWNSDRNDTTLIPHHLKPAERENYLWIKAKVEAIQ